MAQQLKNAAGWVTYIGVTILTLGTLWKIASWLVGFGIQFASFQANIDAKFTALERKLDAQEDHVLRVENRVSAIEKHIKINTN